jgi:hypothetical protein
MRVTSITAKADACKITFWKLERKRQVVKIWRGWDHKSKIDLKILGVLEAGLAACDSYGVHSRTCVSTAMDF